MPDINFNGHQISRKICDQQSRTLMRFVAAMSMFFCFGARAQSGEPIDAKMSASQQKLPSGVTAQMQATEMQRRATMTPDQLKWEVTLEENLGSYYLPSYYKDKDLGRVTAWDYVKDDPTLPRVLIVGDSISRGYTLPVRHDLAGKVNVHRAPANCGDTAAGLKNMDAWLGDGKWDVITWNFGIHDHDTDPNVYKNNLEVLLKRLQKTGAHIIWVRTTPAPLLDSGQSFNAVKADRVNRVADEVMKANGVPEIDLYSLLTPRLSELQLPNNVHFSEAGYDLMGTTVAAAIESELKKK